MALLVARQEAIVFSRHTLRKRFWTACRVLGKVRDAAGHANVTITSGYLHVAVEGSEVGTLFPNAQIA